MKRKVGLFILSLWFFFVLMIVITVDCNYLDRCGNFIGLKCLFLNNLIPFICTIFLLLGLYSYLDFKFSLKGTRRIAAKIEQIENGDYEHLSFLTTYIIPLVCFDFDNTRYYFVLLVLLLIIAIIYIRTDIFYANPTLAVFGYRIYKISGSFINNEFRENIVLISRNKLNLSDEFQYLKLDEKIYYAKKHNK